MSESSLKANIEALIGGMDGYVNTKTVVGEAVSAGDKTLIPLADVSFGLGVGNFKGSEKNNGAGGLGAKITPAAVLVVDGDSAKILSLKESSGILEQVMDIAPGIISKFKNKKSEAEEPEEDKI